MQAKSNLEFPRENNVKCPKSKGGATAPTQYYSKDNPSKTYKTLLVFGGAMSAFGWAN